MSKETFEDLVSTLSESLSAKEMQLAAIQGFIAAEISIKRQLMGLNQKQFAEFMGVSQGLVSRWEGGETNFTLSTLVDIADKLNIKMQCPFVTAPVPVYSSSSAGARIFQFPASHSDWSSVRSESGSYENAEDLLEM